MTESKIDLTEKQRSNLSSKRVWKVLIIDDSRSDRRIYRRFLAPLSDEQTVVEITDAASGLEGLELIESVTPDLILLDFRLPDTNGIELLGRIRKLTEAPIIFITGEPAPLMQTQAYAHGILIYLAKDFL